MKAESRYIDIGTSLWGYCQLSRSGLSKCCLSMDKAIRMPLFLTLLVGSGGFFDFFQERQERNRERTRTPLRAVAFYKR